MHQVTIEWISCASGSTVVEVKVRAYTVPADQAQGLNYLAATGHQTAPLLNFGNQHLEFKRFDLTKPRWISSQQ